MGEDGDESILSARDGDYESGVSVESCKRREEVVVVWTIFAFRLLGWADEGIEVLCPAKSGVFKRC